MNDICTACDKNVTSINTLTITRNGALTMQEAMLGRVRRRGAPRGRNAGKNGTVWVGHGLCDDCAAKVIEFVRTMQDHSHREG